MKALILSSILGIVAMLADVMGFKKFIFPIVIAGLLAALGLTIMDWNTPAEAQLHFGMLKTDHFATGFSALLILLTLFWVLLSKAPYDAKEFNISDHYALIIFAMVGGLMLTSYQNLTMLFLGIEILSIPLYILAGSRKHDLTSNEASIKYFMMGAFASGILLFGIALIYGATASFDITAISDKVASIGDGSANATMLYVGVLLMVIGLGFKVSVVPFHFWTPDVYQGTPTLITGFMATFVKTAAFAAFFRLFSLAFTSLTDTSLSDNPALVDNLHLTLSIIIGLTIIAGNLMATAQNNVKRILAYSGIAQAGYLFLTVLVVNNDTASALLLYTASYSIATLVAFVILYYVATARGSEEVQAFNGLGKSNPLLSAVLTISMLSLAGIPPTAGFFAKFNLFKAVIDADFANIWLIGLAVVGSMISVYYYFKVIIAMYSGSSTAADVKSPVYLRAVLITLAVLIIILGLMPDLVLGAGL